MKGEIYLHSFPSRADARQERLYRKAENALFTSEEILYPSEVKKLSKEGFNIQKISEYDSSRSLSLYVVLWNNPYDYCVPLIVHNYMSNFINTFPKTENFAQELFIIAGRALSQKY